MPLISLKAAVLNFKLENTKMKLEDFAQAYEYMEEYQKLKSVSKSLDKGYILEVRVKMNIMDMMWEQGISVSLAGLKHLVAFENAFLETELKKLGVEL